MEDRYERFRYEQWGLPDNLDSWPTTQQVKAQHLRLLEQDIADLKAAAEDQQMQDEFQQMEQELPK